MSRGLPKDVRVHLEKATDSAMLAVEVYNKPATKFRSGGFIVLMCIAWTSLFHSIFLRNRKQHPDRNAQFEFIAKRIAANSRAKQPSVSVDTKKKEVLGNLKNAGQTYMKSKSPIEVETHDFQKKELGKAVPYGVYDIEQNEAGVTVGISSDTAEFAAAGIHRWWTKLGKERYPKGKRLLITADSGGSNSPRTRLWRVELQKLANKTGLIIEVCHYPPGTSKWNKIEHKLFCHITRNWRGVPLEIFEIVVNLISSRTTQTGLEVHAWLDAKKYETKRKVSNDELNKVTIIRNAFHGDWNYTVHPHRVSTNR